MSIKYSYNILGLWVLYCVINYRILIDTMQNRLKLDVLNFFQGPVTLLRMRETYKAYEN